jgi:hypothetical protein
MYNLREAALFLRRRALGVSCRRLRLSFGFDAFFKPRV